MLTFEPAPWRYRNAELASAPGIAQDLDASLRNQAIPATDHRPTRLDGRGLKPSQVVEPASQLEGWVRFAFPIRVDASVGSMKTWSPDIGSIAPSDRPFGCSHISPGHCRRVALPAITIFKSAGYANREGEHLMPEFGEPQLGFHGLGLLQWSAGSTACRSVYRPVRNSSPSSGKPAIRWHILDLKVLTLPAAAHTSSGKSQARGLTATTMQETESVSFVENLGFERFVPSPPGSPILGPVVILQL
jgi:hypothetical protein